MKFVGRNYELNLLKEEEDKKSASLIAVYGRRRVGKTRLIEEFYKGKKKFWKFDGLENQPKSKQIRLFLSTLARHSDNPLYETAKCENWLDVFKLLDQAINQSSKNCDITLFFDELPYMANRRSEMISDLKWAWDNLWSKKEKFTLVLCGSVALFMVDSVINSSALYGRINLEICLKPLTLQECYEFFEKRYSRREIVNLYMFCGGIPAYLMQFKKNLSVAVNINKLAFCKDGYFTQEFQRIFKDVFHEDSIYRKIMLQFSKYKSLKAGELIELLSMTAGSGFNRYLDNLEKASFIKGFVPCGKPEKSKLKRYSLDDEYLHFYFKFIQPNLRKIEGNTDKDLFSQIVQTNRYQSWAGLAFERVCIKHAKKIMEALKIDQLVKEYGPYYDRSSNKEESVQIDLMFDRYDPVITICEMKYYVVKIGKWVLKDMERKIALLPDSKKTIERILVTTEGITDDLKDTGYFSSILLDECLFD